MCDTNCPYCNAETEINHDDGFGYEDNKLHEQECWSCEKTFTFTTGIIYVYETFKADCLNGKDHEFKQTVTYPRQFTKFQCENCEEKRLPTKEEKETIMNQ
ncbi:hypothetical protein [Flavicella sp.]|uniref:hypothetical protein n=1 Tax=Flavicella sp. TaxID=2957742 RepID=UPI0030170433